MALLVGISAYAQKSPERMVIYEKSGNVQSYLAERVDSVKFPKVKGEVAANIKVLEVGQEKIKFEIQRTLACRAYKFAVIPAVTANRLTDDVYAARYILESQPGNKGLYFNDFTQGEIPAADLELDTKYVAMTLGLDTLGTPCSVRRAEFKTLQKPLIGNPKVTYQIDYVEPHQFSVTFTPNKDVKGFATLAGLKGTMQQQLEQFGPMMGLHNFGDLVKAWGFQDSTENTRVWKDMDPNAEYEVFIQAWDEAGTYAPCDTIRLKTGALGGEGEALVEINLGDFKKQEWGGKMKYSQFVEFVPNDQASAYRYAMYTASDYDKAPEDIQNSVKQDPPMPNVANWFFYKPVETDFQVEPKSEYVALAAAKNINGTWGKVNVKRFTTPDVTNNTTKSVSYSIKTRNTEAPFTLHSGKVPAIKKGIRLTGF